MKRHKLIDGFSLAKFSKELDEDAEEYQYFYDKNYGNAHLTGSEMDKLTKQKDLNDFEIVSSDTIYTTIRYPDGSEVALPENLIVEIEAIDLYNEANYVVRDFSNFELMETFINDRILEGFVVKKTDLTIKAVEMTRKPKAKQKTTVKD